MLREWCVQHFKPIVDSNQLKFAPVTILSGLNSSGKSSLLQSILMISQTIGSRVVDRALLPSEAIVQLGTFESVVNRSASSKNMTFTMYLQIDEEPQRSLRGRTINIKSIKVTASFISASSIENATSSSAIEASRVIVDRVAIEVRSRAHLRPSSSQLVPGSSENELEDVNFEFLINRINNIQLEEFLESVSTSYRQLVPLSVEHSSYIGELRLPEGEGRTTMLESFLVPLSHFLPGRVIRKFNLQERRQRDVASFIFYLFRSPNTAMASTFLPSISSEVFLEAPLTDTLRTSVNKLCRDQNIRSSFRGKTLGDIVNWYGTLKSKQTNSIATKLTDIVANDLLQNSLNPSPTNLAEGLETVSNNRFIEILDRAVAHFTRFFTSQIRYLGPLRADPQAAQRFAPSGESDDVGAKGEYAAAVYDANQEALIEWYNPFSRLVEHERLKVALDTWTRYLGVADQIRIRASAQTGVSWQIVHLEGQEPLPLTAVGVGVSQILPIIVMGLLAPKDTLLIVEQPELHLHARVQSRLGEFFIGLAKCGKQCLIETHSDSLINHLRFHIVRAGGQEKSDCIIYFVTQGREGDASFETIEISNTGNILNWPAGFFDEAALQEDMITAEGIRRRASADKNA